MLCQKYICSPTSNLPSVASGRDLSSGADEKVWYHVVFPSLVDTFLDSFNNGCHETVFSNMCGKLRGECSLNRTAWFATSHHFVLGSLGLRLISMIVVWGMLNFMRLLSGALAKWTLIIQAT